MQKKHQVKPVQEIVCMSESEVCKLLHVSRPTLIYFRNKGTYHGGKPLPYHMLGTGERQGIVYFRHEVMQWLARQPRFEGPIHVPADNQEEYEMCI